MIWLIIYSRIRTKIRPIHSQPILKIALLDGACLNSWHSHVIEFPIFFRFVARAFPIFPIALGRNISVLRTIPTFWDTVPGREDLQLQHIAVVLFTHYLMSCFLHSTSAWFHSNFFNDLNWSEQSSPELPQMFLRLKFSCCCFFGYWKISGYITWFLPSCMAFSSEWIHLKPWKTTKRRCRRSNGWLAHGGGQKRIFLFL